MQSQQPAALGGADQFGKVLPGDLIFFSMTTSSWISLDAGQRRVWDRGKPRRRALTPAASQALDCSANVELEAEAAGVEGTLTVIAKNHLTVQESAACAQTDRPDAAEIWVINVTVTGS
uniref:hypothetical protein n=1 Tax=Paractinoplanes polyasparticus TaxID=2856853 RepID=UPI001C857F8B|nr:hypothetical protein [Actinoplanes polyasparticus]